jgi:hypothetical protein
MTIGCGERFSLPIAPGSWSSSTTPDGFRLRIGSCRTIRTIVGAVTPTSVLRSPVSLNLAPRTAINSLRAIRLGSTHFSFATTKRVVRVSRGVAPFATHHRDTVGDLAIPSARPGQVHNPKRTHLDPSIEVNGLTVSKYGVPSGIRTR